LKKSGQSTEKTELELLKIVTSNNHLTGLPKIIDFGYVDAENARSLNVQENSMFIVQEKYGPSIKDLLLNNTNKLSKIDTVLIGIQLIKIIE
jgi:hypothetical protein